MTSIFLAVVWAFLAVALCALVPGFSWGPGIHIQLTRRALDQIRRRRDQNEDHRIVLAHPDAFLYGNIAADLINFKKYGGMKNHCHNWSIRERLQELARTDLERAFILGYVCHLAADVIAHNHFIPYHRVRGIPPLILGHAYWEALADATVSDEDWDIVAALRRNKALHRNDHLIWEAVRWRALGSRSNKWIFNNILLLNLRRSWRDLIRLALRRRGNHSLDTEFFRHCWNRCLRNMLDIFDGDRLAVLKLRDPTGRVALRGARLLRRDLILKHGNIQEARAASRRLARVAYWSF
jgi:hypothetical protein